MAYLVDSDFVIDGIHNIPSALAALDRNAPFGLAVSIIGLAELYDGAYALPDPEAHIQLLKRFLEGYDVIGLNDETAQIFARLRSSLRRAGNIIPDLDLLIASTALQHDLTLMTRNLRHFSRVAGLRIYQVS